MASGQMVTRDQQVRVRLSELLRALELIEAVVTVAAAALRHQNCEKDADVARVLQRDAGDRLSVEIEKTAALLTSLKMRSVTNPQAGRKELEPARRSRSAAGK